MSRGAGMGGGIALLGDGKAIAQRNVAGSGEIRKRETSMREYRKWVWFVVWAESSRPTGCGQRHPWASKTRPTLQTLQIDPLPAPAATPNLPVNVNYVFGPNDQQPQTWMAPGFYFVLAMIVFPPVLFLPAHGILLKLFSQG